MSFKPSKIGKFRHFYQLLHKILTSGLLRLIKLFDFWIFVALESISSPSKESGKIQSSNFVSKIHHFSLPFSHFLSHASHSFANSSWAQCLTKVDKSQLYRYPVLFYLYLGYPILHRRLLVLEWRVTSIGTFWVQSTSSAILGSLNIDKTIWGNKF